MFHENLNFKGRKERKKGEEWRKNYLDIINIKRQLYLSFIMKSNIEFSDCLMFLNYCKKRF